ncbi:MAG: NAD(P)/FAD-dependent oxidoreductase [Ignavibacteriae bacterium]|nr:NAD(P)/FAD-dependent oxidoreductase [Ignavibacteriota bacterium]
MIDFSVVIIGGGVVGLACAAEASAKGFSTLLIERHESFGQETSSRNSEVIHSGIYYATNSLKATFCVPSNKNLYSYCERNTVWYNRCGKLIVAVTADEEPELERLKKQGETNGVPEIQFLTATQARKLEPNIQCVSALLVPSTGIVDSHELMKAYMVEAKSNGAEIIFGVEFLSVIEKSDGYKLLLKERSGEHLELRAKFVINSAGLVADKVAERFGVNIDEAGYRLYPNRGHYFRVASSKSKLVSRLIYPVPLKNHVGLGTHITLDKGGQIKLGPDQEYCFSTPEEDWYKFDESKKERFYQSVKRYFPALELEDLSPDQIGVRPKVQKPGDGAKDFIISEESKRGFPGLVNLIGIESPGLTCAREIGKNVVENFIS